MNLIGLSMTARAISFSPKLADKVDDIYNLVSRKFSDNNTLTESKEEWRNVLAIRNFTPASENTPRGNFDDMIFVSWLGKKGKKYCQFFNANTDPSYQYSEEGSKDFRNGKRGEGLDANNDGKNDLGMLPLGVYKYDAKSSGHPKLGDVFRPLNNIRVYRDINRDGYFTQADEDLVKDEKKMFEGQTMYIHRGSRISQETHSWSAGCQTLRYEDFVKFKESITAGNKAGQLEFTYVLIGKEQFGM